MLSGSDSIQIGDGTNPCISRSYTGELTIPQIIDTKPVILLGNNAFNGCTLSKLLLPESITTIGSGCFAGFTISELSIPKAVTTVSNQAFMYSNIPFVNFSSCKFQKCEGAYHFGFSRLEHVLLPETMIVMATHMFFQSNLKNITIPASMQTIERGALICIQSLEEFFSNSPNFKVHNKILYNNDYTVLVGYPSNYYDEILDTVTEISSARGFSSSSFTRFTMRQSITKIGPYTFRACQNLEYVDISSFQVNRLYNAAFYDSKKTQNNYPSANN